MKLNKKELLLLLKSVKIMEKGEVLLGIDVDRKIISSLIDKTSEDVGACEQEKIDKFIESLIKEAEEYRDMRDSRDEGYDDEFDREFGPSYPYSDTLKTLNMAIEEGKNVEINYYSANQGKFTKRKVRPDNIERSGGVPYLNAYCFLRDDGRVFKLGRIKEIKIVD